MKQLFALLFALCLLTGCAASPSGPTPPVEDKTGPDHVFTDAAAETPQPESAEPTADEPAVAPIPREEIIVALLDTGIAASVIPAETLRPGWNYVTGTEDTLDRINHGTAVTSVILGCGSAGIEAMAPGTCMVPLVITDKVDGETKSATPEVLAQAIRDSVDKYRACIVNVSLGIKKDDTAVREAVAYVQQQGALVVAAAGNEGDSTDLYYPAAYDGVLTVGSHDKDLKVSRFTQQNGTVDILAPGEDIWLASRNGKTYGARGTSFATGYVSAAAARIWQARPELSAEAVEQVLLGSAATVGGWRILAADAALAAP